MECERCREIVSAGLDGESTGAEFAAAEAHLQECADCRAARDGAWLVADLPWERLAPDALDGRARAGLDAALRTALKTALGTARPAAGPGCDPHVVRLHPVDAATCGCAPTCRCGCRDGNPCRCGSRAA